MKPATSHIHAENLTKVDAKKAGCTTDGNIEYYTCSCGKWFTDNTATTEITVKDSVKIPAAHSYGSEWKSDKAQHWNECSCGDKANVAPYTPKADDGDCTTPVTCSVCGAVTTEAKTAHADSDNNGKRDACGKNVTVTPPHEHKFVEGKCECGETDPNYTPGTDKPGTDNNNSDGSSLWWLWVLIAIVVVGGGIAIFVFVKKKKQQ